MAAARAVGHASTFAPPSPKSSAIPAAVSSVELRLRSTESPTESVQRDAVKWRSSVPVDM